MHQIMLVFFQVMYFICLYLILNPSFIYWNIPQDYRHFTGKCLQHNYPFRLFIAKECKCICSAVGVPKFSCFYISGKNNIFTFLFYCFFYFLCDQAVIASPEPYKCCFRHHLCQFQEIQNTFSLNQMSC